jgi:hypothetical protein
MGCEHVAARRARIVGFTDTEHPAWLRMRNKRQRGCRITAHRLSTSAVSDNSHFGVVAHDEVVVAITKAGAQAGMTASTK